MFFWFDGAVIVVSVNPGHRMIKAVAMSFMRCQCLSLDGDAVNPDPDGAIFGVGIPPRGPRLRNPSSERCRCDYAPEQCGRERLHASF